jgi:hypothetical protein
MVLPYRLAMRPGYPPLDRRADLVRSIACPTISPAVKSATVNTVRENAYNSRCVIAEADRKTRF